MIRAAWIGLLVSAGCQGATVMAGPPSGPPEATRDGCRVDEDCDDEDPCNGEETCSAGECLRGWATSCDDGDPCTDDTCDPGDGSCASTPSETCAATDCTELAPGDEADDGSACNGVEVCAEGGGMEPGAPVSCDDGDPCTTDECLEPTGSCLHTEVGDCEGEPTPEEEPLVEGEDCDDGVDDDGDGWVDCEDDDCSEKPACADGGEPAEEDPGGEICDDQNDNDGDLAIDCYDRDCLGDDAC